MLPVFGKLTVLPSLHAEPLPLDQRSAARPWDSGACIRRSSSHRRRSNRSHRVPGRIERSGSHHTASGLGMSRMKMSRSNASSYRILDVHAEVADAARHHLPQRRCVDAVGLGLQLDRADELGANLGDRTSPSSRGSSLIEVSFASQSPTTWPVYCCAVLIVRHGRRIVALRAGCVVGRSSHWSKPPRT
jgi:hypothetical protein